MVSNNKDVQCRALQSTALFNNFKMQISNNQTCQISSAGVEYWSFEYEFMAIEQARVRVLKVRVRIRVLEVLVPNTKRVPIFFNHMKKCHEAFIYFFNHMKKRHGISHIVTHKTVSVIFFCKTGRMPVNSLFWSGTQEVNLHCNVLVCTRVIFGVSAEYIGTQFEYFKIGTRVRVLQPCKYPLYCRPLTYLYSRIFVQNFCMGRWWDLEWIWKR